MKSVLSLLSLLAINASAVASPAIEWQRVGSFKIARTETTVAQFARFAEATRAVTQAERQDGGQVYEAQAFCRWAGGRLPTDAQWLSAAYTEQREAPPSLFVHGRSYPYPSGERPDGHALSDTAPAGVNGLHDMGGNAWE